MKYIYVASPYTVKGYHDGSPEHEAACKKRFDDVCKITGYLQKCFLGDIVFFSPIAHSHPIAQHLPKEDNTFEFWVENIDEHIITDIMDEVWVVMLDGWMDSKGVRHEIELANSLSKPVKLIDTETFEIKTFEEVFDVSVAVS